jgi:hypothetical protein
LIRKQLLQPIDDDSRPRFGVDAPDVEPLVKKNLRARCAKFVNPLNESCWPKASLASSLALVQSTRRCDFPNFVWRLP